MLRASTVDDFDVALVSGKGTETAQGQKVLDAARARQLPVVLIGDAHDDSFVVKGIKLGAAQVLSRPLQQFTVSKLWHHAVRAMVQRRMAARAAAAAAQQQQQQHVADASDRAGASCGAVTGENSAPAPAAGAGVASQSLMASVSAAPAAASKQRSRSRGRKDAGKEGADLSARGGVAKAARGKVPKGGTGRFGMDNKEAQMLDELFPPIPEASAMSEEDPWSIGNATGIFGADHGGADSNGPGDSDASLVSKGNAGAAGLAQQGSRNRVDRAGGESASAGAPKGLQDPWGVAIQPQVAAQCQALAQERSANPRGGGANTSASSAQDNSPRGSLSRGVSMDMLAPPPQPLQSIGPVEEVSKTSCLQLRLKKSSSFLSLVSDVVSNSMH